MCLSCNACGYLRCNKCRGRGRKDCPFCIISYLFLNNNNYCYFFNYFKMVGVVIGVAIVAMVKEIFDVIIVVEEEELNVILAWEEVKL